MSEGEQTQKQMVDQLETILSTIARLHDQVITLKRKVEGVNPVRDVLAFYDELWINRYARGTNPQVHYDFNRTVDPATVKRWLKTMDAATLKGRITRWFADTDPFIVRHKHPFSMFIKGFNTYAPPANLTAPSSNVSTAPVLDCKHEPPCASDVEHTQRKQRELRTVEA